VGTVNGVNMSDGLDGLAAGLCAAAYAAYGVMYLARYRDAMRLFETVDATRLVAPEHYLALGLVASTVAAACLGFLVYNRHPARVFMGNVSSMALGAGLAYLALQASWGLVLLPVIGFVFVAEVVSVLIQVTYFKATGGKRAFRMAPVHHHFELGGWSEVTVVRRFWLVGVAAGALGVVLYGAAVQMGAPQLW
jgi:phospho-N-acetylmuramoyl-pentapeptide-transferase